MSYYSSNYITPDNLYSSFIRSLTLFTDLYFITEFKYILKRISGNKKSSLVVKLVHPFGDSLELVRSL